MADRPVRKIFNIFRGMNMKAAPPLLAENELHCLYAKGVDFSSGKMESDEDMHILRTDKLLSLATYSGLALNAITLDFYSDGVADYVNLSDSDGEATFAAGNICDITAGKRVLRIITDVSSGRAFLVSGFAKDDDYYIVKPRGAGFIGSGFPGDSFSAPDGAFSITKSYDVYERRVFVTDPNDGREYYATYISTDNLAVNTDDVCRFDTDNAIYYARSLGADLLPAFSIYDVASGEAVTLSYDAVLAAAFTDAGVREVVRRAMNTVGGVSATGTTAYVPGVYGDDIFIIPVGADTYTFQRDADGMLEAYTATLSTGYSGVKIVPTAEFKYNNSPRSAYLLQLAANIAYLSMEGPAETKTITNGIIQSMDFPTTGFTISTAYGAYALFYVNSTDGILYANIYRQGFAAAVLTVAIAALTAPPGPWTGEVAGCGMEYNADASAFVLFAACPGAVTTILATARASTSPFAEVKALTGLAPAYGTIQAVGQVVSFTESGVVYFQMPVVFDNAGTFTLGKYEITYTIATGVWTDMAEAAAVTLSTSGTMALSFLRSAGSAGKTVFLIGTQLLVCASYGFTGGAEIHYAVKTLDVPVYSQPSFDATAEQVFVTRSDGRVEKFTVSYGATTTITSAWVRDFYVEEGSRPSFIQNTDYWNFKGASPVADFPEKVKMGLSQMNPNFTEAIYDTKSVPATDVWPTATSKTYGVSFVREYRGLRDESGLTFVTATNTEVGNATLTITRPSETVRLTWRGNGLDSPSWEAEERAQKTADSTDHFFPSGNTIAWNIYRLEDGEFRLVESVPVFNFVATGIIADETIAAGYADDTTHTIATDVTEDTEVTLQYGSTVVAGTNYYRYIGTRVCRFKNGVITQKASPANDDEVELLSATSAWEALSTTNPVVSSYVDITTATADLGAVATTYTLADNGQLYNLDALPDKIDGIANDLYRGRVICYRGKVLYWSDVLLPTNFYSGVEAQFKSPIRGVVVSDRTLFVVTTEAVYASSSTTFFSMAFERVYEGGAINSRSVCPYRGGLAMVSREGVLLVSGREAVNITEGVMPKWISQKTFTDDSLNESTSAIGTDGENLFISLAHYGVFRYAPQVGFTILETGKGFYGHEGFPHGFSSGAGWCAGRFITPMYYYDADAELKWRMFAQTRVVSAGGFGKHFTTVKGKTIVQTGEITLGRFGFKLFTSVVVKGSGEWEIVILDSNGEPMIETPLTRNGAIDITPDTSGDLTGIAPNDDLDFTASTDLASYESIYATGDLYLSYYAAGSRSLAYKSDITYESRNLESEFYDIYGVTTIIQSASGWKDTAPYMLPSIHSTVVATAGVEEYEANAAYWSIYWPDGSSRVFDVYNADGDRSYGRYDDYFDTGTSDFCMGDVLHFFAQDGQHYWLRYVGDYYAPQGTRVRPAELLAKGMNPLLSADFVRCFPFKGQTIDFTTDEGSTFFLPFDERVDKFTIVLKGRGVINSIEVTGEETT